ncbi:LPXTG-motif cell wall anchor domain-containing protein [Asanoa hainanensis]|uniref:LPXTG-motif cell wall anchor domain-containing protein n=1 Tax=Asanoa hainanensis TaxID=560556 RepID=A0A239PFB4_9ACTN|nr:LPXTG cell wall anchor domain-containing protein [Asanoa hainanensis]SNT65274.1 LPXTG-motif cell wall anchor domain-containing protein [Asanoa hainanensis]
MFHIPSVVRRPLAVAGAAVVGLAAAVVLGGSPASAHHPVVTGDATCVDGKWQVEWKVANSETDLDGDIVSATFTPTFESDTIKAGAVLPKFQGEASLLKATQTLDISVTKASLSVEAHWKRGRQNITKTQGATVNIPRGGCKTSKPAVAFADDCAGQVTVVVSNGEEATKDLRYTIVVGDEKVSEGTVEPGKSSEPFVVPGNEDGTPVKVVVKSKDKVIGEHEWTGPEGGCEPEIAVESTCDDLSISVTNPPEGLEFEVVFTPSTGEPQTMKVEKGKTSTVTFPASDGLTVTPSIGEDKLDAIAWENPGNCEEDTPTLPVTGANAGAIAGGAGGLLVVGAAVFFFARRRRLRFTA